MENLELKGIIIGMIFRGFKNKFELAKESLKLKINQWQLCNLKNKE